ncbi:phage tail protein [Burkholderia ubonensis]|uniref:Phage tail protein n=1 Tax=Burkholderia ubonensis TaxID=101571 RepID=A0AB73FUI2_9BURK|nr:MULTISPECIES: phage major tail tube protein [Burkholderia cepacia complex]KVG89109.1 phage tail protein [Burkholderia ubonensis]KVK88702.1 phage tail protein [Burkholderia ubonensis]KVL72678.1 phage tail protein [Burkholderia ubonensis]KVM23307.1 phage tail protein [Burkholderia ubonensis]KVM29605.1 phage tail protein [Burkholderia ubonensis]
MPIQDIRKYFNVFYNGFGMAGKCEEFNPPKLTAKLEEFLGGGMFTPVEITMGMEKMESDFTLKSFDKGVLGTFGVTEGSSLTVFLREVLEDDEGQETGVIHTMRGKVKEIDPGTVKTGEAARLKTTMALKYYRLDHGGTTVLEIDSVNMIFKQNGVDKLANARSLLGM